MIWSIRDPSLTLRNYERTLLSVDRGRDGCVLSSIPYRLHLGEAEVDEGSSSSQKNRPTVCPD